MRKISGVLDDLAGSSLLMPKVDDHEKIDDDEDRNAPKASSYKPIKFIDILNELLVIKD